MASENSQPNPTSEPGGWRSAQVYTMAVICLGAGLAVGYLSRGSQAPAPAKPSSGTVDPHSALQAEAQPPTLERMKQMGDKAAAPQLEKIKSNPKDFEALNNAGKVYRATHQFKLAAGYYEKALAIEPKNAATRTDLASCLYYLGDVDGALTQLDKALSYDPKFFGALLNAGIIRLQAKNDVAGAVSSWEKILKTDNDPEHKQIAKKLIANAKLKNAKVETAETPKS